jgi:regulatory protein
MGRTPRLLTTEADLYAAALRALMRRAHSVHEMRLLLERKAADATLVPSVMEKLKQNKYLDDARFALEFTRASALTRHRGRFRIALELRARGVPDRHAEAALEAVFAEADERGMLRARIDRRMKSVRGPMDERKLASLYGSLMRAGFAPNAIRDEIRRLRAERTEQSDARDE